MNNNFIIESVIRENESQFYLDVIMETRVMDVMCKITVTSTWIFDFKADECTLEIENIKSEPIGNLGKSDIIKERLEKHLYANKTQVMSMCYLMNGDGIMTPSVKDHVSSKHESKPIKEKSSNRPKVRSSVKRRSVDIYNPEDLNENDPVVLVYIPIGLPSNKMVNALTHGLDDDTKVVRFNTKSSSMYHLDIKRIVVENSYTEIKDDTKWRKMGERFECEVYSYTRSKGLKPMFEKGMAVY